MVERVSITANHGATNTINNIQYYTLIRDTCSQIYNILASHCGPYATDALIITDNDRNLKDRHYAIFTKDGINIVKSIEFISPIQRHIQSLIAYIGERVDSLSHDGTTTSMMLFTKLVELYMNDIIKCEKNKTPIDRRHLKTQLLKILSDLVSYFEKDVITINRFSEDFKISKQDALRFIAYHQAMLSSKGDRELSKAIVEVVETLPVELYGLFSISQSGIETDKRFTVVKEDFNYRLSVGWNIDDMNHAMGTEYIAETCDIIVSEDDLKPGNMALEIIVNHIAKFRKDAFPVQVECEDVDITTGTVFIKNNVVNPLTFEIGTVFQLVVNQTPLNNGVWVYNGINEPLTRPEKKKDLVLITKSLDGSLMTEIQKINRRSLNKIIVFTMSTPNPYSSKSTILSALMNTAGVYHLQDHLQDPSKNYLIKDAKVHFKNRRLYISNLYEKDGSNYHPFYNNPGTFEPYDLMIKEVKSYLDVCISGKLRIETATDKFRYEDYVEIYRRMMCSEVRQLQISGMTHDVLADRDVLQDSFGAVLSSLENGFIIDGYLKFNTYMDQDPSFENDNGVIITLALLDILSSTHRLNKKEIIDVIECIPFKDESSYYFYPVNGRLSNFEHCKFNISENFTIVDKDNNPITIVMQPADTYRELFRRLFDLLPKLINTNRAIIPGTVNEGISK